MLILDRGVADLDVESIAFLTFGSPLQALEICIHALFNLCTLLQYCIIDNVGVDVVLASLLISVLTVEVESMGTVESSFFVVKFSTEVIIDNFLFWL